MIVVTSKALSQILPILFSDSMAIDSIWYSTVGRENLPIFFQIFTRTAARFQWAF